MLEFGGIREVSISGSDDRLCRFRVSLLRARNACRFARSHSRAGIDLSFLLVFALPELRDDRAIYVALRRRGSARSAASAPKERITRKISKQYSHHSNVCRSNITTPGNIVLPGAAERSTNGSSNTRHSRRCSSPRDSVHSSFSVRSRERERGRERWLRGKAEERRNDFDALGNDFPRILLPKRSYLGGGPGSFLLFPYFIFQSRNSRPRSGLPLPASTIAATTRRRVHGAEWGRVLEGGRGEQSIYADLRFARRRLRFPRLEVIITYIRQLTRVHLTLPALPPPRLRGNPRSVELREQFRIQYRARRRHRPRAAVMVRTLYCFILFPLPRRFSPPSFVTSHPVEWKARARALTRRSEFAAIRQ